MKVILQKDAPVLREIAKEVPVEKIKTPKIQNIIKEMKEALASQDDGVAIAAPQIGYSLKIFVVSGKISQFSNKKTDPEKTLEDTVYINPKIIKVSKEKKMMEEGCLSVRYLYGKVKRFVKASVEAYDENGVRFVRGGSGLLAQAFQHETDHLEGTLFIDKAKNLEEIIPEKPNGKK